MKTYLAKQLFDGQHMHNDMHMKVDKGQIMAIESALQSPWKTDIELDGTVSAGFIDIQVNGGGGVLFNDEQTPKALSKIMQGHAKYGTTTMLPTLITDSNKKMQRAANAVREAIEISMPGIAGIHFEGPHLSLSKKGIHCAKQIRVISDADLTIVTRKNIGKVLMTIAPENVPTDIIADLVNQGVVVSLGHSDADVDTVLSAIDAGAHCFTHLFNAMSGLTARAPGMISAALTDKRVGAGLIADLHHVHQYNCKLAYQCIGPQRLMLVTDAMAHVGCDMQVYPWLNANITKVGNKLTLDDGSLAGSCLDMASAVKNMYALLSEGVLANEQHRLLNDALNMASATPANLMGLKRLGKLIPGHQADFILLNQDLSVQASWIKGEHVAGAVINGTNNR
ncbi:MAG: N-acetylglucosamine-6-phosphate deacetylase [Alphaproteobacteria bacterium]|jgi:N-acetylglucosamine-6-phosphate deacetylase